MNPRTQSTRHAPRRDHDSASCSAAIRDDGQTSEAPAVALFVVLLVVAVSGGLDAVLIAVDALIGGISR